MVGAFYPADKRVPPGTRNENAENGDDWCKTAYKCTTDSTRHYQRRLSPSESKQL